MPIEVATHSGSFHADDVLAFAMIRVCHDLHATVVRTRDLERMAKADIVIDVGGVFDPAHGRFDHHQLTYTGDRSSAGMVLDWLEQEAKIEVDFAAVLRRELVNYVDAVDNGRRTPSAGLPCFSTLVGMMNNTATSEEEFTENYLEAVEMAERVVRGIISGSAQIKAAKGAVVSGMAEAVAAKRRVIFLDDYYVWKPAYFENGGVNHPTDFVLFEAEGKCRVMAIPPEPGSFDKKRPLPAEWAGLTDDELSAVVGIDGAIFCHKNLFIAVFDSRETALAALTKWGLMTRPESDA